MAATTMPSISLLLKALRRDFPRLTFIEGETFSWSPTKQTIRFALKEPHSAERLLHEVAHAELRHQSYKKDIDLIALERDAWQLVRARLAKKYCIEVGTEAVEAHMDSYRDWLHARSTCPHCTAIGLQTGVKEYTCVACRGKWKVNEARICALRRYKA